MTRPRRDATFVATVLLSNVSAYLFHVVMIRMLDGRVYGALGAIVGVLTITSVPMGAVQTVVARRIATVRDDDEARVAVRSALRFCGALAASLFVLFAVAAPFIARGLRVPTLDVVLAVAGLAIPSCLGPVGRGVLQGRQRFVPLGVSMAAAMAVRLALGSALVAAGLGLRGAILGLLLGEAAGLAVTFLPVRSLLAGARSVRDQVRGFLRDSAAAAATLGAFWTLVSIDVVLARALMSSEEAGRYATAAVVGKTVLYLPSAIAMLVFPTLAQRPTGAEARRTLARSIGIVAGLGGAATLGIVALPGAAALVFGSGFHAAAGTAAVLAVSMTAFGIVSLLMFHCLALRRVPLRSMWLAVAAEAAAIAVFHSSPTAIALATLAAGFGLILVFAAVSGHATRILTLPEGALYREPDDGIELSVVTPVFNGGSAVAARIEMLLKTLDAEGVRSEVILVSDGSTDGTPEVAAALGIDRVRVVHYEANRGKGYALRTGMAMAGGRHVAFIDADGDLDPADLARFLRLMPMYGADLVVGSKRHPLSEVRYPVSRRIMSWGYHLLVRILFGIKVSDTQTGIKLIRREALAEVLPRLVEKRFAFDLELIVALRRAGHRRILEAPVSLDYQFSSTVSKKAVAGIIRDTLAIWYRRYLVRQYDGDPMPRLPRVTSVPQPVPQRVASGGD